LKRLQLLNAQKSRIIKLLSIFRREGNIPLISLLFFQCPAGLRTYPLDPLALWPRIKLQSKDCIPFLPRKAPKGLFVFLGQPRAHPNPSSHSERRTYIKRLVLKLWNDVTFETAIPLSVYNGAWNDLVDRPTTPLPNETAKG
jgi:hypothetical protein